MFGIDEMCPVINPPQALILGTPAGIRQPWNVDGELALATVMAATASFDHSAIDGAVAAPFMAAFRDSLENPLRFVASGACEEHGGAASRERVCRAVSIAAGA